MNKLFECVTNVKNVLKNCFSSCENLQIIEFLPNSGLKIIEDCAFSSTAITSIPIPPHVTEIKSNVFNNCNSLREVFCENSELHLIGEKAFESTYQSHLMLE